MKRSDHVTRNQIEAFGAGALAASHSRVIGGHLIRCVECRSLLPLPNAARVWTAITSENDYSEGQKDQVPTSTERTFGGWFAGFFGKRNRFALAGGMLAVVVSLGAIIILSVSNERNRDTDVARSSDFTNPPHESRPNEWSAITSGDPGSSSAVKVPNSNSSDRGSGELREKPAALATSRVKRPARSNNRNISATRGEITPCSLGKAMDVELGSSQTDLVLRWKPVPKVAKYHVYVSDDSEILIDEFETEQETSYVLKKQLDPARSYKWKIVVSLESGQNLYVDSKKFTSKDLRSSLSGYKWKARSNTRCLANE